MNPIDPRRRPKLAAFAVLVVTFLAGTLTGAAYERVARASDFPPGPPRPGPAGPFRELRERLSLTDAQDAEIRRIFEAERPKMEALFDEMRPRMQARVDSTTAAVEAVLTPAQRDEFRAFRDERMRHLDRMPFLRRMRDGEHRARDGRED